MNSNVVNFLQNLKVPYIANNDIVEYLIKAMGVDEIVNGRRIIITGEIGCGKSTLLGQAIRKQLNSDIYVLKMIQDSQCVTHFYDLSGQEVGSGINKDIYTLTATIKNKSQVRPSVIIFDDFNNFQIEALEELDIFLKAFRDSSITMIFLSNPLPTKIIGFFEFHKFEFIEINKFTVNDVNQLWVSLFESETRYEVYLILTEETDGNIGIITSVLYNLLKKKIISFFSPEKIYVIHYNDVEFRDIIKYEVDTIVDGLLVFLSTNELELLTKLSLLGDKFSIKSAYAIDYHNSIQYLDSLIKKKYLHEIISSKPINNSDDTSKVLSFSSGCVFRKLRSKISIKPGVALELLTQGLIFYSSAFFETLSKFTEYSISLYTTLGIKIAEFCSTLLHDQFLPYHKQNLYKLSNIESLQIITIYDNVIREISADLSTEQLCSFQADISSYRIFLLLNDNSSIPPETKLKLDNLLSSTENCTTRLCSIARLQTILCCFKISYLPLQADILRDEFFKLCATHNLLNHPIFYKTVRTYLTFLRNKRDRLSIVNFEKLILEWVDSLDVSLADRKIFEDNFKAIISHNFTFISHSLREQNKRKDDLILSIKNFKEYKDYATISSYLTFYLNSLDFYPLYNLADELENETEQINSSLISYKISKVIAELGLVGNLNSFEEKTLEYSSYNQLPEHHRALLCQAYFLANFKMDIVLSNPIFMPTDNMFSWLNSSFRLLLSIKFQDKFNLKINSELQDNSLYDLDVVKLFLELSKPLPKPKLIKELLESIMQKEFFSLSCLMTLRVMLILIREYKLTTVINKTVVIKVILNSLNWLYEKSLIGFIPPIIEELKFYKDPIIVSIWEKKMISLRKDGLQYLNGRLIDYSLKIRVNVIGIIRITSYDGKPTIYSGKIARLIGLTAAIKLINKNVSREFFGNILNESVSLDKELFGDTIRKYSKRISDRVGSNILDIKSKNYPIFLEDLVEIEAVEAYNLANMALSEANSGNFIKALANLGKCYENWAEGQLFENIEGEFFDNVRAEFESVISHSTVTVIKIVSKDNPIKSKEILLSALKVMPDNEELMDMLKLHSSQ